MADTFIAVSDEELEVITRRAVSDLHAPRASVFWTDLLASAAIGWASFVVAVAAPPLSPLKLAAGGVSGLALYRGLCFTHELTHLRRGAVPGFETVWNLLFGVPLLLPSFTYIGVHQSHHSLSTYGTKEDPEYLPFARSRRLILTFAIQASVLTPLALVARFLVLAPVGLVWPRFHRWLETYVSSFSMNPAYRRSLTPTAAAKMRRWEAGVLAFWAGAIALLVAGVLPAHALLVWYAVLAFVSFLNTARVLGAHEYDSEGAPLSRHDQLSDSIDTPGRLWTELWAPVGLRYHALHHYFPGIPYHNLGLAYCRILDALPGPSRYQRSTSASLGASLRALYAKAKRASAALIGGSHPTIPAHDPFRDH
jgi:fatty acid desaturase